MGLNNITLTILLSISLSSQADNSIKDKVTCTADSIVINSIVELDESKGILSQIERMNMWREAITKKLSELERTQEEVEYFENY
jgi:hypothetical protein